jgi:hypothetical protein
MNTEEKSHLHAFIEIFVPKSHKNRWKALISSKSIKWQKIKPYDIWPEDNNDIQYCQLLEESYFKFLSHKKYKNIDVVIFPCGHDNNEVETIKLNTLMSQEYYLLEGIISIIPGKLALLVNHDGEICVFEKKQNT